MNRDTLIKKWLNDDLDASEKEAFKQLDDYQSNLDIIDSARHFKASNISEIDEFEIFKARYKPQNKVQPKRNWLNPLLRIAAVLVVGFGIYFSFFNTNLAEFQTLAGEKSVIELPDNSEVRLNALSTLSFNEKKWNATRKVELEGEAYFIVAKGKQFDVHTAVGTVTVVGTEFNVKQRSNYFEVKCFEGIVKVSSENFIRQLNAGEVYRLINGQFYEGKTDQTEPQWTNDVSSFDGISLDQVIFELERQYNIDITLNNVNTDRIFSGGFTHKNLEEALISITQPMNLTYKINSSTSVVINGQ
ncbi:MAG: DUF4974 domain-containing protein [Flavobacteriaceae bacterium]|nr:DUF4974 domain-containing protein [Flavobacteriaceae bacterium]